MSLISRISASGYKGVFRLLALRRRPKQKPIELTTSSRVLCFTCAGIGDTLTDSVVFKALRETYGGLHLAAVVHRRRKLLVEHNPYVDQIFEFHKGPTAFWHLAEDLQAAGPWDAILHLRGNDPEPRCLSFLVDPDVTVSIPDMTHLSWLCGHNLPQPDWSDTHGVEQTLRIARYLGANTAAPHLVFEVRQQDSLHLKEKLRRMVLANRPWLVLQLGGGRRASWRDWPIERYAQLINLMTMDNMNAEIFVLGGKDQVERAHELDQHFAHGAKPYHDVVNKLSLAESAALLAHAKVLISTDTGIMHLGYAVGGCRVISLIHCNNPEHRVGPYGYGQKHPVIQLPRPANYQTPADANMADIAAQTVYLKLKEIWH